MAQLQELARYFIAAGAASSSGKGMTMLYAGNGSLISKHWNGEAFQGEELIAKSIRPGSVASYILTPTTKRVVCISNQNVIRILRYDNDEEEWVDETIQQFTVHPKGQVVAVDQGEDSIVIVFQGYDGKLVILDDQYQPVTLPITPVIGSPLTIADVEQDTHIYYLAEDHTLHTVFSDSEGVWQDSVFADNLGSDHLAKVLVANDPETGVLSAMFLTSENQVILAGPRGSGSSKTSVLGTVAEDGKFVASTSAECGRRWAYAYPCRPRPTRRRPIINININGNGNTVNVRRR